MTATRALILAAFLFNAFGCGGNTQSTTTPAPLDQGAVVQEEKALCATGQHLRDDPSSFMGTFSAMGLGTKKVFAFSYGSDRCALKADVSEDFPLNGKQMHFTVTLMNTCLPNGSLWEIGNTSVSTTEVSYQLRLVGGTDEIRMNGNPDLSPAFAQKRVGLRSLTCQ